jgi:hypothetical protein
MTVFLILLDLAIISTVSQLSYHNLWTITTFFWMVPLTGHSWRRQRLPINPRYWLVCQRLSLIQQCTAATEQQTLHSLQFQAHLSYFFGSVRIGVFAMRRLEILQNVNSWKGGGPTGQIRLDKWSSDNHNSFSPVEKEACLPRQSHVCCADWDYLGPVDWPSFDTVYPMMWE